MTNKFAYLFRRRGSRAVIRDFNPTLGLGGVGAGLAEALLTIRDRGFGGGCIFPSRHLGLLTFEFFINLKKMFDLAQHVRIHLVHVLHILITRIVVGDSEYLRIALSLI